MEENDENLKLISELKEIIQEYEQRLNSKDKNFQLQFSELQNELIQKYSQMEIINDECNKKEFQLAELTDLIQEKDSVIWSKDNAIQILQSDLKQQLDDTRNHYEELLTIRQEEIESLRMTSHQLREQLNIRENDIILMMQRHENQIIKMFHDNSSKETSTNIDYTIEALNAEITDVREMLFQKQESLKVASVQIEEQDKLVRQLQDKIFSLNDEANKLQKLSHDSQKNCDHDAIKDNKKKQLTLKAKVNSLEKRCESLTTLSHKEEEKYRNLNKELTIREQVIEKQNILIDELRQTERNLRQNLDKAFIMQQNQLIELQYWQDVNKLKPPEFLRDISDESDTLTGLEFFLDKLENIYANEHVEMSDKIRCVIDQLKTSLVTVSHQINHVKGLEMQVALMETYVDNLHSYNVDLNKHVKVLIAAKYENCEGNLVLSNSCKNEIENCSKEDLILKVLMITESTLNYSEEISKLEHDNYNKNTELEKARMTNGDSECEHLKQIGILSVENAQLMVAIKQFEDDLLLRSSEHVELEALMKDNASLKLMIEESTVQADKINCDIVAKLKENEELAKIVSDLKEDLILKEVRFNEVELLYNHLKDDMASEKLNFEQSKINEGIAGDKVLLVIAEKEELEKLIDGLKTEKQASHKDLEEKIISLQLSLEEFRANEISLNDKLISIMDEKTNLQNIVESLTGDLMTSEKTIKNNSVAFDKLDEKIISLESLLKELNDNKESISGHLQLTISEKEILSNKIKDMEAENCKREELCSRLNEGIVSAQTELGQLKIKYSVVSEEIMSVLEEKGELLKTINILEEDVTVKCKELNDLNEQIIALKVKLEEFSFNEKARNEKYLLVIEENKEFKRSVGELNDRLFYLERERKVKMELYRNLKKLLMSFDTNLEQSKSIESEEFQKAIKELQDNSISRGQERKDTEVVSVDLDSQMACPNVSLTEARVREDTINEMITLLIDEKDELKKAINELQENSISRFLERKEIESVCVNLNDQIACLKVSLTEASNNENLFNEKISLVVNEKGELQRVINNLRDDLILRQGEITEKEDLCNKLNSELSQLKIESDHLSFDDKVELQKVIDELKEGLMVRDRTSIEHETMCNNQSELIDSLKLKLENSAANEDIVNGKLLFVISEKEKLDREIEGLKNVIELKEKEIRDKESSFNNLNDEIGKVKLNMEQKFINDKKELQTTIEKLSEDLFSKERDVEESNKICRDLQEQICSFKESLKTSCENEDAITISLLNGQNEFEKMIGDLKDQLKKRENEITEKELFVNNLNQEMVAFKVNFEQIKANESSTNSNIMSIIEERGRLENVIDELNERITQISEKAKENDTHCRDFQEENVSLKLKLEELYVNGKMENRRLTSVIEENEEYKKIINVLKDDIAFREKEAKEMEALCKSLNEEIISATDNCEQSNNKLIVIMDIKEQLSKNLCELKEHIALRVKEVEDNETTMGTLMDENLALKVKVKELNRADEVISITRENECLKNTIEEMEGKLILVENAKDMLCNRLNGELAVLNKKLKQSHINDKEELQRILGQLKEHLLCSAFKDENISLKVKLEEFGFNEDIKNKELISLIEERDRFRKRMDELSECLHASEEENKAKDRLYRDLNDKLVPLNLNVEEPNTSDGHLLHISIDKLLEEVVSGKKEKEDNESFCDDLKDQIGSLKSMFKTSSDHEYVLCANLALVKEANEQLQNGISDLRNDLLAMEAENNDIKTSNRNQQMEIETLKSHCERLTLEESEVKDELHKRIDKLNDDVLWKDKKILEGNYLCSELNEQVVSMKLMFEESTLIEDARNRKLMSILDEKEELQKCLSQLKEKLSSKDCESKEKEELNEEILSLKLRLDQSSVNENNLGNDLFSMTKEREELHRQLELLKSDFIAKEKEYEEKETIRLNSEQLISKELPNNQMSVSNVDGSDLNYKMNLLIAEKTDLEKSVDILKADSLSTDVLRVELEQKHQVIEKLEKNNLLLKAKSLKLKRQLDGTLASTKEKSHIFTQTIAPSQDYILRDPKIHPESSFPPNLVSPLHIFTGSNSDERSFISRIQSLTDDVDLRARKANLELEQFLEQNEQVTSGLSSDLSPNRRTICTNLQCQRMSTKNRNYSLTIANLQQQNELMKNKIVDLQRGLECEQEVRKQISLEGLNAHETIVQKLHDSAGAGERLRVHLDKCNIDLKESRQRLDDERRLVKNLTEEINKSKIRDDRTSIDLINAHDELNRLKELLKEKDEYISILEGDIKELRGKNNSLMIENTNIGCSVKVLTEDVDRLVVRSEESDEANNELMKTIDLLSANNERNRIESAVKDLEIETNGSNAGVDRNGRDLIKSLSEELSELKISNDRTGADLIRVQGEFEKCLETLKKKEEYISILEGDIKEVSEKSNRLIIGNTNIDCSEKVSTEDIDCSIVKSEESAEANNELVKTVEFLSANIEGNCIKSSGTDDDTETVVRSWNGSNSIVNEDEVVVSLGNLVETVTGAITGSNDVMDLRYDQLLRNNRLIEDRLLQVLGRMSVVLEHCSLVTEKGSPIEVEYGEEDIVSRTVEIENSEFNNEIEVLDQKELEIKMMNDIILNQSERLEDYRLMEVEMRDNFSRLNSELTNVETEVSNLLKDIIPADHEVLKIGATEGPKMLSLIYIDCIKSLLNDRSMINNMADNDSQTLMGFSDLDKMDDLMNSIICELPQDINLMESDCHACIEQWIYVINGMRNQVTFLKKDIVFLEQEKCELSEKFERLFVELEMSCDTEMEEIKIANVFLNNEIKSLQTEKEVTDRALKNYEVQISYLQSTLGKPEVIVEKEEAIQLTRDGNSQFWLSDLNDALKETISEKEDHITELMDRINESSTRFKESIARDEQLTARINNLEGEVKDLHCNLKTKENLIRENNSVINELEAVCVEKENRINLLEKESGEINVQLEQYISAVCSMQARLEASKPNLELILTKIENKDKNVQLLNLIDQLEKDYADELEVTEINKSKVEAKLNKAIQIIHKLKKQLKESHVTEIKLSEELRSVRRECLCDERVMAISKDVVLDDKMEPSVKILHDVCVQIDDEELRILREENTNYKGVIENLHVNNFMLWKELDSVKKTDRNTRGSSLPPMNVSGNGKAPDSERSVSPVSQLSWNSCEANGSGSNQLKDLQRKLERVHQQLNQMRIERNRIHQEYSRVRQLKEVADAKVTELMKKIDVSDYNDCILTEKDDLIKANNQYSAQVVELQSEIEMTKVRHSIMETKCKKIELKLTSQRRKYDQLVLKLDEKEQEIDRGSDELRKIISNFEKEKIIWLREKREIKSLLVMKEEKITDLRKRLLSKTNDGESCENDFLMEINQLQTQSERYHAENKQISALHREQVAKFHGQIEELIDENRQLKRKLSFGHNENNIQLIEPSKKACSLKRIEEDSEEVVSLGDSQDIEINTVLANVVLEKEKMLVELSDLRGLLNDEKVKVLTAEEEMKKMKARLEVELLIQDNEVNVLNAVTKDSCNYSEKSCVMVDECIATEHFLSSQSTQISQSYDVFNQASQTGVEFYEDCFQIIKKELLGRNVNKSIQVNDVRVSQRTASGTQTDACDSVKVLQKATECRLPSRSVQTDPDDTLNQLHSEIKIKNNLIQQYQARISKNDHYIQQSAHLNEELNEALKGAALFESKNLEYQELIGELELKQIENDRKYSQDVMKLKQELSQVTERISEAENRVIEVNDKADQTLLCQPADEGWDMEWDYEKLTAEHHLQSSEKNMSENLDYTEDLLSVECESPPDRLNENLMAILREEITNLKTTIGDRTSEIDQLKCLRNQLQNDLLESGQQIKDSNMEFLNLKENIQALHAERDILRQKAEYAEGRLVEMVYFTDMVTMDLQRLRDCGADGVYSPHEDNTVQTVVKALERELHHLLERHKVKDLKLETALSKIEQLSCSIHRLQLQKTQPDGAMSESSSYTFDKTMATINHDNCINNINELSELLEKRHLEIEGLKSRLFLATDQLIHFRTFFADSENRLHKELMLITRHHSLGLKGSAGGNQTSPRDYTKVTLDSDEESDSDQSLLSHDGSTVIRVERSRISPYQRPQFSLSFLDQLIGSPRYKRFTHNFKRVFTAGRRHIVSLRSQPRINLRAVLAVYLALIHLLVIRCVFL